MQFAVIHAEHLSTLYGLNIGIINVQSDGMYSYRCAVYQWCQTFRIVRNTS